MLLDGFVRGYAWEFVAFVLGAGEARGWRCGG